LPGEVLFGGPGLLDGRQGAHASRCSMRHRLKRGAWASRSWPGRWLSRATHATSEILFVETLCQPPEPISGPAVLGLHRLCGTLQECASVTAGTTSWSYAKMAGCRSRRGLPLRLMIAAWIVASCPPSMALWLPLIFRPGAP